MTDPADERKLHPAAELARIEAIIATTRPPRIHRALEQLRHTRSPLHAASANPSGTGLGDPTGDTATPDNQPDDPAHAARQLTATVLRWVDLGKHIDGQLSTLAPNAPGNHADRDYWCPNHRRYNIDTPRKEGRRHCGWCGDVLRSYGKLPNHELVKAHHQGRRLTEQDYRRALKIKATPSILDL